MTRELIETILSEIGLEHIEDPKNDEPASNDTLVQDRLTPKNDFFLS